MGDISLGELESRFADIIWEHEPVGSMELVKLAEQALGWKKSTTFTVLRRLCAKGLFRNEDSTVTSLVSREGYASMQSTQFVDESFGGSLPSFLAAFTSGRKLTEEDVAELRALIDSQEV